MKFETLKNPEFKKHSIADAGVQKELRRIPVPNHRLSPLKSNWESVLKTLVDHMKLQVRMNTKRRCVEIRSSKHTQDVGAVQKSADFLKAFMLGFEL